MADRSALPDHQLPPPDEKEFTSITASALDPDSLSATPFNAKLSLVLADVASANTVVWDDDGSIKIVEKVRSVVVGSGYT